MSVKTSEPRFKKKGKKKYRNGDRHLSPQCWGCRNGQIPGAHWPTYLVSSYLGQWEMFSTKHNGHLRKDPGLRSYLHILGQICTWLHEHKIRYLKNCFIFVYVCMACVWRCMWRPEEGIRSLETGVMGVYQPFGRCSELSSDHPEE